MSGIRLAVLLWLATCLAPAEARADWLVTPFIGMKFAGETTFVDLDGAVAQRKLMLGGAAGWLGDGILGLDVEFGYGPRFFQRARGTVLQSRLTTLTGNVIVAAPVRLTQDSLRPFATGGLGLMYAMLEDLGGVVGGSSRLLALSLGGGAIGPLTDRTALRFDIRHFRTLSGQGTLGAFGEPRLSFWRASTGVTVRY